MKKQLLAAAAGMVLATSAYAQDQYIFGFSGLDAGNRLTVNGSTQLRMIDQGWYSQTGVHDTGNQNYIVGQCTTCFEGPEYRNWFAFDIANLTSPVTSLSLRLFSYSVTLTSGNYYLNDYTGSIDSLVGGTGGLAAFNDLGGGVNYGFQFYQSATDSNQFFDIALNGGALASLNAAIAGGDQRWALGGSFFAGDVAIPVPPGTTVVPLPPSLALMLAGLVGLRLVARRKSA